MHQRPPRSVTPAAVMATFRVLAIIGCLLAMAWLARNVGF